MLADPVVRTAARVFIAVQLAPAIAVVLVVLTAYWFFTRP